MTDSTSEPTNVVPLFKPSTEEPPRSRAGGGSGGGNFGPRLTKLEKHVALMSKAINTMSEDVSKIEKRTRYLSLAPSHKEVLIWLAVLGAALCSAYLYITPIEIDAKKNVDMSEIRDSLSAIAGEIREQHTPKQKESTQ